MSIQLQIEGMSCGHCQKAVDTALRNVKGVTAVSVSLEGKSAQIEGTPDLSALIAAVQEEGYSAKAV
ncbi:MAG: heavy-metal-associated domain-containing protein [Deinococcales bacterium]